MPGPLGKVGWAAPGCHRQLPGRLRASPLSPEPLLGQEVWKPSLKLQEKFGKISCNYPNDSCTNHTTTRHIPRRQAEPKTGRAKTHIWIQGDLWKLSLQRAWVGGAGARAEKAAGALALAGPQGTTSGPPPLAQTYSEDPQLMEVLPAAFSARLLASRSLPGQSSPGDSEQGLQGMG